MTDAELQAEQDGLARDYVELKAEYVRLKANPHDVAGHLDHLRKMRAHVERLRVLTDTLCGRQRG